MYDIVFCLRCRFWVRHPQVGTYHKWVCKQAFQHCLKLSDRGSWAGWCPIVVRLLARRVATCWPSRDALLRGDSSAGLLALAGWDLAPGLNKWGKEWGINVRVVWAGVLVPSELWNLLNVGRVIKGVWRLKDNEMGEAGGLQWSCTLSLSVLGA